MREPKKGLKEVPIRYYLITWFNTLKTKIICPCKSYRWNKGKLEED